MKSFWKDYVELVKQSNKWFKKHWKGYLVICAICLVIPYVVEKIMDKIEIIKSKSKNNSEEGGNE